MSPRKGRTRRRSRRTKRKRRVEASKESEVCSRSVWLLTCADRRAGAYLLISLDDHRFFIETRPL